MEDQKRRHGAGSQNPSSLLFALSLSVQRATERSRELTADATRGWRLRRGTPRRRTRAAGAARGTVERHHGGALWPELEGRRLGRSRRPTAAAARRAACGCVSGSVLEGSNRPLGLYRYPHGLTVYCARHSAQRRHRTPNWRHGDATALWRTSYTPEPWRRRGESQKNTTAIWRRYGVGIATP